MVQIMENFKQAENSRYSWKRCKDKGIRKSNAAFFMMYSSAMVCLMQNMNISAAKNDTGDPQRNYYPL